MKHVPDRIEKRAVLRAPQAKAWSARSRARGFGYWFGAEFEGPFAVDRRVKDGTLLTIVESGFDEIPLERRAEAYAGNEGGWALQAKNIARYLEHHAR